MKLHNQTGSDVHFELKPSSAAQQLGVEIVMADKRVKAPAGSSASRDVFIKFPTDILKYGSSQVMVEFQLMDEQAPLKLPPQEVPLVGPIENI
jgi:hypothetical protein